MQNKLRNIYLALATFHFTILFFFKFDSFHVRWKQFSTLTLNTNLKRILLTILKF